MMTVKSGKEEKRMKMKKLSSMIMSLACVCALVVPAQVKAAGADMQIQKGTKILVGMEQDGKTYTLPIDCQTVYSLVVNPLDLQPKLVAFDATGKQQFAVDYRDGNASVDIYVPLDATGTQKQCTTLDLATGAAASHSSVYIYTDNGLATTQHDLDIHDIKNGVVTGTIESEEDGFFYDAQGKMTSGNYDQYKYTYDAAGKLISVEADGYSLGRFTGANVVFTYEYDADGDLSRVIESDTFSNGYSSVVSVTNFIY